MSEIKMDAEIVASSIHKGDFSKLRGKSFKMCDNKNMKGKYTLNELGSRMDRLETKLDQIADDLTKLTKCVVDGFKRVDTRLDYIVKANDLKDLPKENR